MNRLTRELRVVRAAYESHADCPNGPWRGPCKLVSDAWPRTCWSVRREAMKWLVRHGYKAEADAAREPAEVQVVGGPFQRAIEL